MFDALTVLAVDLAYISLLFLLALRVERKGFLRRLLADNPYVYVLSLAVYCTSWTYYGSVGKAATSGAIFLTIYLGPTAAIVLWPVFLRKLVRIKCRYRITSIADFLSARYGKSRAVAALVTLTAVVGTLPYIALQMKAVQSTFGVIAQPTGPGGVWITDNVGLVTTVGMILFTIVFGVRRLDPTERHQGMIAAVALESLVKLAGFLACGLFVTFMLNDGVPDILEKLATSGALEQLGSVAGETGHPYMLWATWLVLAMAAITFLPRQFHVAVVENAHEGHVRHATWLLPLYLLCISLFVVPIAAQGLTTGMTSPDTFVLDIPMSAGRPLLALFVFIGGFSAAMSMVMISAMALATMLSNQILLPFVAEMPGMRFLRSHVLESRWVCVVLVLTLAHAFERAVGGSYMLVNMGIISFAAALQFAPAAIGGMYWGRGNRVGALLGLGAGSLVWAYTLLLPALVRSGWVADTCMAGPWCCGILQPEALFGLSGLDPLVHSVLWSLAANIGFYVFGSLAVEQDVLEKHLAREFVGAMQGNGVLGRKRKGTGNIDLAERAHRIEAALAPYFPADDARDLVARGIRLAGLQGRTNVSPMELADMRERVENLLAGAIGAAMAHKAVSSADIFSAEESDSLARQYVDILAELQLSPEALSRKVEHYQDLGRELEGRAEELERLVAARTEDLSRKALELEQANVRLRELDVLKSNLLTSVSHELRTPLTSILGFAKLIGRSFGRTFVPMARGDASLERKATTIAENLMIIHHEGERLTRLINDFLDLNKIEEGRMNWDDREVPLTRILERSIHAVGGMFDAHSGVRFNYRIEPGLPNVHADPDHLQQVVINLLNNASKFTDKGAVSLFAGVVPGGVVIQVCDTGEGVPRKDLHAIFDKFYQVVGEDTIKSKPKGSGLGLVISQSIVEHYGGLIWVDSERGKGSCFHVELPEEILREPSVQCELPPVMVDASRQTILVVDDDPSIRALLRQLLELEGYAVVVATDGRECLEAASRHQPDLITLDLMMPVMDGREAMAALRGNRELSSIPVFVISVLPERGDVGGDAAAGKPIDEERFLETVRLLLERHKKECPPVACITRGEPLELPPGMDVCSSAVHEIPPEEAQTFVLGGFSGTLILPHGLVQDVDVNEILAAPGVNLVILAGDAGDGGDADSDGDGSGEPGKGEGV